MQPFDELRGKELARALLESEPFCLAALRLALLEASLPGGADHTTLPSSLASIFGLNPEDGAEVQMAGLSGPVIAHLHEGFKIKISDHELDVPVLFADGLQVLLIGRHKVFEYFKVTFDEKTLKVKLDPN